MSEEGLAKIIRDLLDYSEDKGQIYSATDFAIMEAYLTWLGKALGCPDRMKPWARLVSRIVELSRHEFSRGVTVWQKALDLITRLNYQVENVEVKRARTPIASWGKQKQ